MPINSINAIIHTRKPTELEKEESQPLIQININHPIIYSFPTNTLDFIEESQ